MNFVRVVVLAEELEELEMEEDNEPDSASAEKPDDASGCFKLHTGNCIQKYRSSIL